jgi:hypothetical protein
VKGYIHEQVSTRRDVKTSQKAPVQLELNSLENLLKSWNNEETDEWNDEKDECKECEDEKYGVKDKKVIHVLQRRKRKIRWERFWRRKRFWR